MNPHGWYRAHRVESSAEVEAVIESIRDCGVELEPKSDAGCCGNGIVLFGRVDDELCEILDRDSRHGFYRVLALALRSDALSAGAHWRLLDAGAADVFAWDASPDPWATVAARFERYAAVDDLLESPTIRAQLAGESPAWIAALRQVVEVAAFSDASILLTGESGTGKELVARLIHALDRRTDKGQFIVLDCTTVSPELAGSEFFGHERGAFTTAVASRDGSFALADRGTLFLDEVGELPLTLQAQLLRVVQERVYKRVGSNTWKQVNFRLICATNRKLLDEEAQGTFRRDFYHRIASCCCAMPPLVERREDILPLARHFLCQLCGVRRPPELDAAIRSYLLTREYPGNVRELKQLVTRMHARHVGDGPMTVGDIPPDERLAATERMRKVWHDSAFQSSIRHALAMGLGLKEISSETAELAVQTALADEGGNLRRAARRLGVTDRALQMRRAVRRLDFSAREAPASPTDRANGE